MKSTKELTGLILDHPELSEEQTYNQASGKSSDPEEAQAVMWAVHVLKQKRDDFALLTGKEVSKCVQIQHGLSRGCR